MPAHKSSLDTDYHCSSLAAVAQATRYLHGTGREPRKTVLLGFEKLKGHGTFVIGALFPLLLTQAASFS